MIKVFWYKEIFDIYSYSKLKNNKDQEFYDLFASALDDVATDVQETTDDDRLPTNKSLNEKRPMPHLDMKRKPSTGNPLTPKTSAPLAKKNFRKELGNIDNEAFQRIKLAIENFSKAHQNVLIPTQKIWTY